MPRADRGPRPCIIAYKRTYFANIGRQLASADPTLLAAATLSACLAEARLEVESLSGAIYGNVYSAGLRQNPARRVLAHLARSRSASPESVFAVPAMSVNSVCNSSGEAVLCAARRILCGEGEVYAAGGFESMSRAAGVSVRGAAPMPPVCGAPQGGAASSASSDSMTLDGLADSGTGLSMGALADAALSGFITRKRSDEYAKTSCERRISYLRELEERRARDPTVIGLHVSRDAQPLPETEGKLLAPPSGPAPELDAQNLVYSARGVLRRLSGETIGLDPCVSPPLSCGLDHVDEGLPSAAIAGVVESPPADGPAGKPFALPPLADVLLSDTQIARYSPEKVPRLTPCFSPSGLNTAASSSAPCDGAATLLLASREAAERLGPDQPASELVAYASVACRPEEYALAPARAIREVLRQAGLSVEAIARFRINEAFAGVPLFCADQLGIELSRLNVTGDALAIGHPLGVSSCRALGDVHNELQPGEYGVASACNGGGGAVAFLIKRFR